MARPDAVHGNKPFFHLDAVRFGFGFGLGQPDPSHFGVGEGRASFVSTTFFAIGYATHGLQHQVEHLGGGGRKACVTYGLVS